MRIKVSFSCVYIPQRSIGIWLSGVQSHECKLRHRWKQDVTFGTSGVPWCFPHVRVWCFLVLICCRGGIPVVSEPPWLFRWSHSLQQHPTGTLQSDDIDGQDHHGHICPNHRWHRGCGCFRCLVCAERPNLTAGKHEDDKTSVDVFCPEAYWKTVGTIAKHKLPIFVWFIRHRKVCTKVCRKRALSSRRQERDQQLRIQIADIRW